jgi:small-conductance mechanosensitive channel
MLSLGSTLAAAEEPAVRIDESTLISLERAALADPANAYVQKRIEDERKRIHALIEQESAAMVPSSEEESLEVLELTKAVDRQQTIVTTIADRLSEHRADLDLLKAEEEQYYLRPEGAGAPADAFRLTKTHAELLAKKTILEERIGVLEGLLSLQEQRLQTLVREQRLRQFAFLITVGKYLLVLIAVWLFERLARGAILRRIRDSRRRYTVVKVFSFVVYSLAGFWILGVVLSKKPEILASLAIVGAGLAIALQDLVKDLLGWIFILQNGVFSQGDRITVGAVTGEVIDIGLLRTTLLEVGLVPASNLDVLERTGKTLTIPNAFFLTHPVTNHHTTSDFVRAEMRFAITYESNWKKARRILQEILDEITGDYVVREQLQVLERTRMYYIPHRTRGNQVYLDIAADGVECTLRFTVPVGDRRPVVSDITDRVLERFAAEQDIHLAYRTSRVIADPAARKEQDDVSPATLSPQEPLDRKW